MTHYLKITNFGPLKETAELNFEPTQSEGDAYEVMMPDGRVLIKLAYVYGANASGKTTVLKAFDFLRRLLLKPVSDKALELDYDPFLFCEAPYDAASRFELSFYADGVRYVYEIDFNKQSVLNEKIVFYQTAKPTELLSRTTDIEKRLSKVQFGSRMKVPAREKDLLESNTLHNNTVIGAYAKTNVDIPELEKLNLWFNDYLLGMVTSAIDLTEITALQIDNNPAVNQWINNFLNKADQQITEVNVPDASSQIGIPEEAFNLDFKTRPPGRQEKDLISPALPPDNRLAARNTSQRKIDFIHHTGEGKNYSLSILKESSGTKRYFGLGGPLYALIHGAHLLCIDELETSLHPDLMKHFLQTFLLNAGPSQMLVTTHNIALMEEQDFIRRDALWFCEKGNDGAVSLYSAADFDSTTLRKDASLVNAYKSGRLGAKPNLGSPYVND